MNSQASCGQFAVSLPSSYCSLDGSCQSCPQNFADCLPTNLTGQPDTHKSGADCETQTNLNGIQSNCGACNAQCGYPSHKFQSCCKGQCKCGFFNHTNTPTDTECSAAAACSETEYCDQGLGICLPLARQNVFSCNLNARTQLDYIEQDISDSNGNTVLSICGSCNRTTSYLNVFRSNLGLVCSAFYNSNCGPMQLPCLPQQVCINGECICNVFSARFMAWNPFY